TGEDVSQQDLGGAAAHSTKSGIAAFTAPDDEAVLDDVRFLLGFLPSNNMETAPELDEGDPHDRETPELVDLIPDSANVPYDMCQVIETIADDGEFVEYLAGWAKDIVCGFIRLGGRSVGVVGNQPAAYAGVLDIEASEKAARFVRPCDGFNVPLLTFVDV